MFEQIELVISGIAAILGSLLVILQKMGFIFKKDNHIKTLEKQIDRLKDEIYSDMDNETDKAHETHVKIFEKLEELSNTLAYLKGVMDRDN